MYKLKYPLYIKIGRLCNRKYIKNNYCNSLRIRAFNLKLYEILNVSEDATGLEIMTSYVEILKNMKQEIIDHGNFDKWKMKYYSLNIAYKILSDSHMRYTYDMHGFPSLTGQIAMLFSILNNLPQNKNDIKILHSIELETCVNGGKIPIKYKIEDVCPTCLGKGCQPDQYIECPCCHGKGTVTINTTSSNIGTCPECGGNCYIYQSICLRCKGIGKMIIKRKLNVEIIPGIRDGTVLKIIGKGNKFREQGDLYIGINIKEHKNYKIIGDDIYSKIKIPYYIAILGGIIGVKTVYGTELIDIMSGTQNLDVIEIKNKGMPSSDGIKGSHYIIIKIMIPKELTKEEKEILNELKLLTNF